MCSAITHFATIDKLQFMLLCLWCRSEVSACETTWLQNTGTLSASIVSQAEVEVLGAVLSSRHQDYFSVGHHAAPFKLLRIIHNLIAYKETLEGCSIAWGLTFISGTFCRLSSISFLYLVIDVVEMRPAPPTPSPSLHRKRRLPNSRSSKLKLS